MSGEGLTNAATRLLDLGYRLALVAGHDDGPILRIVYLFLAGHPDRRVELTVEVDAERPRLTSLAEISFPAGRFERELVDLFGVELVGHPMLRRLVKHQHWPADWHPMRRDPGPTPELHDTGEPYPFGRVEGDGVYEIPVGPVHAGLIEPGHFRFWAVGETVLQLKARLWFAHKGVEKLFEGRDRHRRNGAGRANQWRHRCRAHPRLRDAVEEAAGIAWRGGPCIRRSLLLELERIHNHSRRPRRPRQRRRVRHRKHPRPAICARPCSGSTRPTTGHRLLRGGVTIGGARLLALPDLEVLDFGRSGGPGAGAITLGNATIRDRFCGTAVLSREAALHLGTLGYVARASGVDKDARRDHPFIDLGDSFAVVLETDGDVPAATSCGPENSPCPRR